MYACKCKSIYIQIKWKRYDVPEFILTRVRFEQKTG